MRGGARPAGTGKRGGPPRGAAPQRSKHSCGGESCRFQNAVADVDVHCSRSVLLGRMFSTLIFRRIIDFVSLIESSVEMLVLDRDERRITSDVIELVEAAGVEPASENSGDPAPTCLALAWISPAFCPESRKQTRTSLAVFVIRGEAGRESLAHIHGTRTGGVSNLRSGRRSPN